MVRLYAAETARKLTSLFKKVLARGPTPEPGHEGEQIGAGYQAAAEDTPHKVFGGN